MKDFSGRIAVVTGGGTGMGRELVLALVAEGARVAACDVSMENLEETRRQAEEATAGAEVLTVRADVSVEADLVAFRDAVADGFETDHINLLFNNAGIAGVGSVVAGEGNRDQWERTFNVCWYGVYYGCRVFMPMLVASDEGYIVNTGSLSGTWASMGPNVPHTAYCTAKFAVQGFTEALITDLRLHAPHVKCAVVMPGLIKTSIGTNSEQILGTGGPLEMSAEEVAVVRERMVAQGLPVGNETDDQIRQALHQRSQDFWDKAPPTTSAEAVDIILNAVREGRWRVLVGEDAVVVDQMVRADPERAYEPEFAEEIAARGHLVESMRSSASLV